MLRLFLRPRWLVLLGAAPQGLADLRMSKHKPRRRITPTQVADLPVDNNFVLAQQSAKEVSSALQPETNGVPPPPKLSI